LAVQLERFGLPIAVISGILGISIGPFGAIHFLPKETINVLRTYNFEGIYPSVVSSIPLDYGATDSIEEFQVTFNYLFWTVGNGLPAAPAPGTT